jgi:23S rRNA pseudouridine1911/1915/1917 synthase
MLRKQEWWGVALPHPAWDYQQPHAYEELQVHFPIPHQIWLKLCHQQGIRVQNHFVWFHLFKPEESKFEAEYDELEVLYEDDFVMVVNKPSNMLVHPENRDGKGTLANLVTYYWLFTNQTCAVRHIHRLDRDTSGTILYAKNEISHVLLDEAMRNRQIHRTYIAFVQGRVSADKGTIQAAIARDRHHHQKYRISSNGKPAITHFQVLARYQDVSMVQLQLETGRTHQIRVHMQHIGHPIAGDLLYGGNTRFISRQSLHAIRLEFNHPITQESLVIHAPWPQDLLSLQEKLV